MRESLQHPEFYTLSPSDKEKLDKIKGLKEILLPEGLTNSKLLPLQTVAVAYQAVAKRYLLHAHVGFGKTITSIASAILGVFQKTVNKVLIVAPSSSLRQFAEEIKKETDTVPLIIDGTPERRAKQMEKIKHSLFSMISYAVLQDDLGALLDQKWDLIIFDECTVFKNKPVPFSKKVGNDIKWDWRPKVSICAKALCRAVPQVIFLSGTPLHNNIVEIYWLISLLDPTIFGKYDDFLDVYCNVKEKKIRRGFQTITVKKITLKPEKASEIRELIKYRVLSIGEQDSGIKSGEANYIYEWIELTPEQRKRCDEVKAGVLSQGPNQRPIDLLARLVYQLEICNAVSLVDPSCSDPSPKVDKIRELIKTKYSNEKLVIFSNFTAMNQRIIRMLDEEKIPHFEIVGKMTANAKNEARKKFRDCSYAVMIISTAGEMGLNLQSAGVMIIVDRLYNPSRMTQIVGRIKRQGQKRERVDIVNLIMKDSVEEYVLNILRAKKELYDFIFGKKGKEMDKKKLLYAVLTK